MAIQPGNLARDSFPAADPSPKSEVGSKFESYRPRNMSHERKKDGERKDKKNERMHADVRARKEAAAPKHSTDQKDLRTYKSGSQGDKNVDPSSVHDRKGA
jgi:hypothetical protein